jgi:hypothetical protein
MQTVLKVKLKGHSLPRRRMLLLVTEVIIKPARSD